MFDASLGSEASCSALNSPLSAVTDQLPLRGFRVSTIVKMTEAMTWDVLENAETLIKLFASIESIKADCELGGHRIKPTTLANTLTVGVNDIGLVELRDRLHTSDLKLSKDPSNSSSQLPMQ